MGNKLVQIDKQELLQLQDQKYSNEGLCMILETMETIAHKKIGSFKKKYDYYDLSGLGDNRPTNRLFFELITQLETFKITCSELLNSRKSYPYAKNLNYNEILEDLRKWVDNAPELKEYAEGLIKILRGEPTPSFGIYLKNYIKPENCYPPESKDILGNIVPVNYNVGQLAHEVQKNYENGITEIEIKKNEVSKNNPIKSGVSNYKKKMERMPKNSEKTTDPLILGLYKKYYLKSELLPCKHDSDLSFILFKCDKCNSRWYFHYNCNDCSNGCCQLINEDQESEADNCSHRDLIVKIKCKTCGIEYSDEK